MNSWRRMGMCVGGLCGVALFAAGCKRSATAPAQQSPTGAAAERPWFEDVTARSGLHFVHAVTTNYFMPEHIGSGAAVFDYDNDGRLDVYLLHNAGPDSRAVNQLFHQESDGTFKNVSAGSGLDVAGWGMGAAVGDVNNDGWADVAVTEYGAARLFLNQNGKFREITRDSGIDNPRWATSVAFVDYDRDGWLDLVIANYVDYDPTHPCYDARGRLEYCGPHGFAGTVTKLFRNRGAWDESPPHFPALFEDVTVRCGLARHPGPALGVVCADFDGDRWPDIFLADDGQPNRLFLNRGDGTFVESAATRGLAYNAMGRTAANMGVGVGDVNGDGWFDLFVTHLTEETPALWQQGPRGVFQDRAAAAGLAGSRGRGTGFGAVAVDFDLDGAVDLAWVNGRIKRDLTGDALPTSPDLNPFWKPYAQRHQLLANDGTGQFRDLSAGNPALCGEASVGRGLACGDFDNDGAVDLLITSIGGPARLLRNAAPRRGHWLSVRAIDPKRGGRDAIGAEVVVRAGGRRFWRLVHPAFSYLCSNDPRAHFGLGAATSVEAIEVLWPDGSQETFPGSPADRAIVLRQGDGTR